MGAQGKTPTAADKAKARVAELEAEKADAVRVAEEAVKAREEAETVAAGAVKLLEEAQARIGELEALTSDHESLIQRGRDEVAAELRKEVEDAEAARDKANSSVVAYQAQVRELTDQLERQVRAPDDAEALVVREENAHFALAVIRKKVNETGRVDAAVVAEAIGAARLDPTRLDQLAAGV